MKNFIVKYIANDGHTEIVDVESIDIRSAIDLVLETHKDCLRVILCKLKPIPFDE